MKPGDPHRVEPPLVDSAEGAHQGDRGDLVPKLCGASGAAALPPRRPSSRFGSALQPLAYVEVIYYQKEGRTLQTLKEATHVERFSVLTSDLDLLTLGMRLVELVRAMMPEGEPQPTVLQLLVRTLGWLDARRGDAFAANALPWFQLHLAALLGFAPDLRRDDVLTLDEGGGVLLLDSGAVAPPGLVGRATTGASRAALRAFAVLARADLPVAGRMRLEPEVRAEVEGLVEGYLRFHTEGTLPDRVRRVAGQIEAGLAPPDPPPLPERLRGRRPPTA